MEEQKRHSGFETMRILSMVMIVLMHGIGHGGLGSAAPQGSAAFWIYWLLFILARVSTNCFVMLSGYYLSERKGAVRAGRLFRIGAQVWFYSMLTFCVAVKAGAVPLSAISLLRALLPLTSNGYWFASAAMFLLFQNIRIRSDYWRRWVFRLAPLSFGVYLLHDSDFTRALLWQLVDLPRFGGALLPSLAYLTGAVLLIAAAGYAVDAVYQRLYRLLHLPALETKLDALTARILQNIVGSKE